MGDKIINGSIIKKHLTSKSEDRRIDVEINTDSTEAYMTVSYELLNPEILYTPSQIREALGNLGIVYGIIDENLIAASKSKDIFELPIAKGIKAINDEEDIVDIKFSQKSKHNGIEADTSGKVDYRNVGEVTSVKKGDLMAIKIIGQDGADGIDIFGNPIFKKKKKKVALKAGDGCTLLDENTVIADLEGEPYVKSNVFYVYDVHTINKDVSLETGDIVFVGDIKIFGNVKEGMRVEAGNMITIQGNIESAKIIAKGDISINGNSIMSTITAGGKDMKISKYISILEDARDMLDTLTETITVLKRENVVMNKIPDGEIIKGLMETKFNDLPKRCWGILRESFEQNNGEEDPLANTLRGKLIGMAPLTIKHHSELSDIITMIDERIEELGAMLTIPVDVNIGYCQDCTIESSGNIMINGSGQYVSQISADRGIYFTREGSIARGGVLKANTEIICKTVGSQGGVKTKLMVGKKGHIRIELAYQNTIISVGGREAVIDVPSTNIFAYINKERELVVEKLNKV